MSTDYDYKRAYGGVGDEASVSTAGGTKSGYAPHAMADLMNDETMSRQSRQRASSDNSSKMMKSVGGNISMFSEDESFEAMYNQEEKFMVTAPPGKLGIVIDTPSAGVPVVHAIKDSSALVDKVRIGDKLVSVDGIDTTSLSAIRVSKIISSRAENQRMMVFSRSRNEP
jgi:C-terminal processing protease CtpA/Prc